MTLIRKSSYKVMPWKNGGGITAEIDRAPAGEGLFDWRLSQAEIASDGPFSTFPDCDRWLCALNGGGLLLADQKIEPQIPFRFSGDRAINCRLINGPVSDLGFIFNRKKISATMSIVEGTISLDVSALHYFFDIETGETLKVENVSEMTVAKSIWISVKKIEDVR